MKNVANEPCVDCGKVKENIYFKHKYGQFSLCISCYNKRRRKDYSLFQKCAVCGNLSYVQGRTETWEPICKKCKEKYYSDKEKCSKCGVLKTVKMRTEDGKPICRSCRDKDPKNYQRCCVCGKIKLINIHKENGEPICLACYKRNPTDYEKCSICGKLTWVWQRDELNKPLCRSCCRKAKKTKSVGYLDKSMIISILPKNWSIKNYAKTVNEQYNTHSKRGNINNSKKTEKAKTSKNKYTLKKEKCSRCNKTKMIGIYTLLNEPICTRCYKKDPSNYKRCPICGKIKTVNDRAESGQLICHACYARSRRNSTKSNRKRPNKKIIITELPLNYSMEKKNKKSSEFTCSICQKDIPKHRLVNNPQTKEIICLDCYYKMKLI